jgi:predicted dehydrogenase
MPKLPLRAAFLGCGGIAEHYLSVYRELDGVALVTCVDVDRARATPAAQVAGARATTDEADALAADVDVVVINTPNHLHREQTLAALVADKHVLLQKPVAANLADAEVIAEAAAQAESRGLTVGLYLSYFDQPLMHDLRAMVQSGWFGEVTHLYARLMHRGGLSLSQQIQNGAQNWRASLAQTGGGCFIQLAVHYVHLFRWMMNARVVRVMAMTKNQHCPGIEGEDLACAILEFSNGALATLDMAWNTAGEQLSIHGTRGTCEYIGNQTLMLDSIVGAFKGEVISYKGGSNMTAPGAPGSAATQQISTVIAPALGDIHNPFNQHRLFLEAVRDGRAAPVSIASGVEDLRVVKAVYESAHSGCAVPLAEVSSVLR